MKKNIIFKVVLLLSVFLLFQGRLWSRAQQEDIIPPDPSVINGTLPNGLKYYIRKNDKPENRAELRLIIKAGSVLEDEDQRGLAHFTEHMMFNGTKDFPKNDLIDALEAMGMKFGPDINAYTSFDETVYQLFVRTDKTDQFETGIDILKQWLSEALLTEDEYEKERGVIYEEYRLGRGADARMFDKIFPVLFKGSKYAERLPIGSPEVILNAPVENLRRFYNDWYRPDLSGIIAVGDFDPGYVEKLIIKTFSSIKNPEDEKPRKYFSVPEHNDTLITVVTDPEAVNATVEIYTKFKQPEIRFRPDIKTAFTEQLYEIMANQRFIEITRKENPPFIYGYAFNTEYTRAVSLNGLVAASAEKETLKTLKALLTESERMQRYGFTEEELSRAKADMLKSFESYWKDRNNLESSSFTGTMVDSFLKNSVSPSIDWQWKAMQEIVPQITTEDIRNLLNKRLTDKNRVIIISGPQIPEITDISENQVMNIVNEVENSTIEPWLEKTVSGPLVKKEPAAGKIIKEKKIADTGITKWTLSNGATVIIKPTDFKDDEILFMAYAPGGASIAEDKDYISALLAVDAVTQSGLGNFSADNLTKALAGKNVSLDSYINEYSQGFSGSSTPGDLETLMQLIYLSQTSPRKDTEAWNSYITRLKEYLKNRSSDPRVKYQDLFWQTLYDNHFRSMPVTSEKLSGADLDYAYNFYKNRFSNASDFTYIFTGSVDPEKIKILAEKWIGGQPSSENKDNWIDRKLYYTDKTGRFSVKAGKEPLSIVSQIWYGNWDGSWQERYRIQSLCEALEIKLLRTIREESSGTYSISVYPSLELIPKPQYRINVQFSCAPERVDELTEKVKRDIELFRSQLPDDHFAHDVKESQIKSLDENITRNSWWLNQIFFAVKSSTNPQEMINRKKLYNSLTSETLNSTAKRYINYSKYIELILYPESYNN